MTKEINIKNEMEKVKIDLITSQLIKDLSHYLKRIDGERTLGYVYTATHEIDSNIFLSICGMLDYAKEHRNKVLYSLQQHDEDMFNQLAEMLVKAQRF